MFLSLNKNRSQQIQASKKHTVIIFSFLISMVLACVPGITEACNSCPSQKTRSACESNHPNKDKGIFGGSASCKGECIWADTGGGKYACEKD